MHAKQENALRLVIILTIFFFLVGLATYLYPGPIDNDLIQVAILGLLIILNGFYFFTQVKQGITRRLVAYLAAITSISLFYFQPPVDMRLVLSVGLGILVILNIYYRISARSTSRSARDR